MLKLENIQYKVNDNGVENEILDDINLTIDSGKIVVITGPNGGGKSTLARLIMGIAVPTAGRIYFDGADITDLSVTERARLGIGFAFQQPPRFKGMSVRDLLGLAYGEALPEDKCCEFLTRVGLCSKDYLNREVDTSLSGGEVKRIEIATVMARKLKLAIYDEPEAGIDLWSFSMLIDTFKKMTLNESETLLIISHQERILKLADEIVIVRDGRITDIGDHEKIFPKLQSQLDNCELKPEGSENRWIK